MSEPIFSHKNECNGINAHLNSILQTPGSAKDGPSKWHSFHTNHLGDITNVLNRALPQRYLARIEQSLQIRTDDFQLDVSPRIRKPQPAYVIFLNDPRPTLAHLRLRLCCRYADSSAAAAAGGRRKTEL